MDRSVKERIKLYKQKAAEQIERIRIADPLTEEFLNECLYIYVKRKYLLDDGDCTNDRFADLIETSIAKSLNISKNLVTDTDTPGGCDGTTSAMTKKVLLLIAIQKELGIKFPPEKTGSVKTVSQLSELVYSLL